MRAIRTPCSCLWLRSGVLKVWSVNGVLSISSSPPSLGLAIVSVWPRLQSSQERPPWLRVDFDHWEELSDGEEGAEGGGEDDGDATTGHKKPLPRERLEEIKKKQVVACP